MSIDLKLVPDPKELVKNPLFLDYCPHLLTEEIGKKNRWEGILKQFRMQIITEKTNKYLYGNAGRNKNIVTAKSGS